MKKVTLETIMNWNPCEEYPEERIKKLMGRKKYVKLDDIWKVKLDNRNDYLWFALRSEFISEENLHLIAIYAAELVLPVYEKKYPDDDRPRKAIQAKKDWLKGKITDNELKKARHMLKYAANAVYHASRHAAWSAVESCARYASWYGAGHIARYASWYAAAVNDKIYNKIIKYIKRITK